MPPIQVLQLPNSSFKNGVCIINCKENEYAQVSSYPFLNLIFFECICDYAYVCAGTSGAQRWH